MKFLHPNVLWALLIIALPILIHLLNLRKFKPLLFPNVSFIQAVKEQTKKKSKITRWLQLVVRCLAFAALVFAFAQPYTPAVIGNSKSGETMVCLYLDNSFSMQGKNETGDLFNQAKQQAINIVKSFEAGTKFIFTNNLFDPLHSKPCDANQVITFIQESHLVGQRNSLSAIQTRQLSSIPSNVGQVYHFYLSDFQSNQFHTENVMADSIGHYMMVQFNHVNTKNIMVDSIWFSRPTMLAGSKQTINIQLRNIGDQNLEDFPLSIWLNENKKQQLTVSVKANATNTISNTLILPKEKVAKGKVVMEDYPMVFDNELLFTVNLQSNIIVHTLVDDNTSHPLSNFFQIDSIFKSKKSFFGNPDFSQLEKANVICLIAPENLNKGLVARIAEWTKKGKTLIVLPSNQSKLKELNSLFSALSVPSYQSFVSNEVSVSRWELNHPIFKDVLERQPKQLNYPKVNGYFATAPNVNTIAGIGSQPIVEQYKVGNGILYRINAGIDENSGNLSKHALFLTALFRMGELTTETSTPYYQIGSEQTIRVDYRIKNDEVIEIKKEEKAMIPYQIPAGNSTIVTIPNEINKQGFYELWAGDVPLQTIALNYNRLESDLAFWNNADFISQLKLQGINASAITYEGAETNSQIASYTNKSVWWQYCLWIMLVFLTLELFLNKRW